jgi:hypothetical protein
MALAERMPVPSVPELLAEITRGKENEPILVVVAEHVSNPDNVGAMFRSALALGWFFSFPFSFSLLEKPFFSVFFFFPPFAQLRFIGVRIDFCKNHVHHMLWYFFCIFNLRF